MGMQVKKGEFQLADAFIDAHFERIIDWVVGDIEKCCRMRNGEYHQVVKDADTGAIIHEKHEPLTQHKGKKQLIYIQLKVSLRLLVN